MTATPVFAATIETAINRWLKQDERSATQLAALEGKVIEWQSIGFGSSLYFLIEPTGIQVLGHYEGEPDTRITASVTGLARSVLGNSEDALFAGAIRIEGDTALGQAFQDLLSSVDFDWEEQLSKYTGDVIAHQAGKAAHNLKQFASNSSKTLQLNLSEYLQEEARLLPTRIEIEHFLNQVDHLRSDTDRLQARLDRLYTASQNND